MHKPLRSISILLFVSLLLSVTACSIFKSSPSTPSNKPNKPNKPTTTAPTESAEMRMRGNIVSEAKRYVGTPYKYAGKNPSTGFDCSGFTFYVLDKFDIAVSPSSSIQANEGKAVALNKVKPGDLIIFRTEDKSRVQHVSMVVENTKDGIICVHSTTSRGVIVENVSQSSYWKPRIWKARDVVSK